MLVLGLELAIDPFPPGGILNSMIFRNYIYKTQNKRCSPLRGAALTCSITLYTITQEIALNVPDNVSTMTCSYIFAC